MIAARATSDGAFDEGREDLLATHRSRSRRGARVIRDPIQLPGRTTIGRKGLLEMGRPGRPNGDDEADLDRSSVKRVVGQEGAATALVETAFYGSREQAIANVRIVKGPKVLLWFVETKGRAFDAAGRPRNGKLDEVEAAAENGPDRTGSLIFRPIGLHSGQRIAQDPDLRPPGAELPVEIMLAVALRPDQRFGRGRLGGDAAETQQRNDRSEEQFGCKCHDRIDLALVSILPRMKGHFGESHEATSIRYSKSG